MFLLKLSLVRQGLSENGASKQILYDIGVLKAQFKCYFWATEPVAIRKAEKDKLEVEPGDEDIDEHWNDVEAHPSGKGERGIVSVVLRVEVPKELNGHEVRPTSRDYTRPTDIGGVAGREEEHRLHVRDGLVERSGEHC